MLLCPAAAAAEEWYENYAAGVKALAQGQAARAVSLLELAASQRPLPGRNVVTYGTNIQREYYPYLHLAEAYLRLRDAAGARWALKRADSFGREPQEGRRRLHGQLAELEALLAPATPAPEVTLATAPPETTPPAPPETMPAVLTTPPPVAATPPARPTAAIAPAATPRPGPSPVPATPSPDATRAEGTLEVASQPPGASVYVDDQLVGVTDPEWGRLTRNGIAAGRHRVRLELAGHRRLREDVEVPAGGRVELRRRLEPSGWPVDPRVVVFAAVLAVLLGLTVWALRRPAGMTIGPVFLRTRPGRDRDATPARITPAGFGIPGVRRGPDGRDYFGEYQLIEPLGRGGMASVFKAERNGEICALKRPLPAFLEEPEFLERFTREAEIGRTLHHPNIVRILERGDVDGVPYFTMELVPGETLQQVLARGRGLEVRTAATVAVQIAEALDYAHLKGVVHRDLKPSNVMVLPDGLVKVMDYGIARTRRFEGLTVTGSFLGSPEYAAPEAIEGNAVEARSDLYSLGVILYEALTGERPFTGDTPFAVLRKHLSEEPVPPSRLRAGLPPELERIALKLLAKEPGGRYANAEELVVDLRDYLNRAA